MEYVYDEKCCRYVFKYLMKGCDMAYVRVQKKKLLKKNVKNNDSIVNSVTIKYDFVVSNKTEVK